MIDKRINQHANKTYGFEMTLLGKIPLEIILISEKAHSLRHVRP